MEAFEILLIAVGLSLDVFTYALCKGAVMPEINRNSLWKMCGIFTFWQTASLLMGSGITRIPFIAASADRVHWQYCSIFIFLFLGLYMLFKAFKRQPFEERKEETLRLRQIVMWACITSLDAFLAGIGFGFFRTDIFLTAMTVGLITFVSVVGGVCAGYWMGSQAQRKLVTAGGVILLAGGIELLLRI